MSVTVSKFDTLDIDCLHREAVWRLSQGSFVNQWSEQDFAYFLAHPNRLCLGAFEQSVEHPLRAYFLGLVAQNELDIVSVATHPECRRQGLARSLVRHALARPEIQSATLEVEQGNLAAEALYRSCGFVGDRLRPGYYGPERHAVCMRWRRNG